MFACSPKFARVYSVNSPMQKSFFPKKKMLLASGLPLISVLQCLTASEALLVLRTCRAVKTRVRGGRKRFRLANEDLTQRGLSACLLAKLCKEHELAVAVIPLRTTTKLLPLPCVVFTVYVSREKLQISCLGDVAGWSGCPQALNQLLALQIERIERDLGGYRCHFTQTLTPPQHDRQFMRHASYALVTRAVLPSGFKVPSAPDTYAWVVEGRRLVLMRHDDWEQLRLKEM